MKKNLLIFAVFLIISCSDENNSSNENDSTSEIMTKEIIKIIDTEEVEILTDINNPDDIEHFNEWDDMHRVFIFDLDDLPTNVRNKPKGDIILKLPKTGDYEVYLKGELNGWFKVDEIDEINENKIHENVDGFIHGSILAAATRNYGGEKIHIYKQANDMSDIVYTLTQETMVFLVSSNKKGNWLKVRIKTDKSIYEGWIRSDWLCGSIRTNCS